MCGDKKMTKSRAMLSVSSTHKRQGRSSSRGRSFSEMKLKPVFNEALYKANDSPVESLDHLEEVGC
jgi:hypothetical protein